MKNLRINLVGIFVACMSLVACSGDDGAEGPAGPAGANGNANVQGYSYTLLSADWSAGSATVTIPQLSKEIAENGQVAAYWTTQAIGTDSILWNPLPYRFVGNVGGTNTFITLQNSFQIGSVTVSARSSNNTAIKFGANSSLRVVLIPSSNLVENIDLNDYEAVKSVYGLKEEDF